MLPVRVPAASVVHSGQPPRHLRVDDTCAVALPPRVLITGFNSGNRIYNPLLSGKSLQRMSRPFLWSLPVLLALGLSIYSLQRNQSSADNVPAQEETGGARSGSGALALNTPGPVRATSGPTPGAVPSDATSHTSDGDALPESLARVRERLAPVRPDPDPGATERIKVQDRLWLERNGYPSDAEALELLQASDDSLRIAAREGNSAAGVVLAARGLSIGGDAADQAETELLGYAAEGNNFALASLAAQKLGLKDERSQIEAFAFMRVEEMRGNLGNGLIREIHLRHLTPIQRMEGERYAHQILRVLVEAQQTAQGPDAPLVDPRPVPVIADD